MTSIRIAFTELERLFASGLARTAILAMILVPALYGGLYLYANHDPYDALSRVPAAVVVLDEGAEGVDGEPLNAGFEVSEELVAGDAFDWQQVTEEQAADGVEEGTFEFALVIPAGFSEALTSPSDFEPEQARLTVNTNDANSYLSTTIADRITDSVRDALAERIGSEAASTFLIGLAEIRDDLGRAEKGAGELRTGLAEAARETARLERRAERLIDRARDVAQANGRVASRANSIAGVSSQMLRDYQRVRSTLIRRLNQVNLSGVQRQYLLGAYNFLGQRITLGNRSIQGATGSLDRLGSDSDQVTGSARDLSRDADQVRDALADLRTASAELQRELTRSVGSIPQGDDRTRARMSETIADPVDVRNVADTEADSYGEGLAPFLLALAAWIGGYALFLLVRPLSNRAVSANQGPFRVALAGLLTPALIGAVQVALLAGVVLLAVDIVPEDVPLTIAFLLLASVTFIAILHCLNAWFGLAGQFLGLVLLVLQLVTTGGTFPWQTIPEPLHWLHHALPMSYAVDGLRQLMYGGRLELAGYDAAMLFAWFVAALALTTLAARRQRTWTVKRVKPELAL
jgi:putative membrane protein